MSLKSLAESPTCALTRTKAGEKQAGAKTSLQGRHCTASAEFQAKKKKATSTAVTSDRHMMPALQGLGVPMKEERGKPQAQGGRP